MTAELAANPSIPSIKLKELIIKMPIKVVKQNPGKYGIFSIPRKPFKLSITSSLEKIINTTAIS